MESETKTEGKDELENPEVGRDSKVKEPNGQSTIGNDLELGSGSHGVKNPPNIVKLVGVSSEARLAKKCENESMHLLSFMGWTLLVRPAKKPEPVKNTYRFIPRVLRTQKRNSCVPKSQKPQVLAAVAKENSIAHTSNSKDVTVGSSKSDVIDNMNSLGVKVQSNKNPEHTAKSPKNAKEGLRIGPNTSTSKTPPFVPANKERKDLSNEPYKPRQPDLKRMLGAVKCMANEIRSGEAEFDMPKLASDSRATPPCENPITGSPNKHAAAPKPNKSEDAAAVPQAKPLTYSAESLLPCSGAAVEGSEAGSGPSIDRPKAVNVVTSPTEFDPPLGSKTKEDTAVSSTTSEKCLVLSPSSHSQSSDVAAVVGLETGKPSSVMQSKLADTNIISHSQVNSSSGPKTPAIHQTASKTVSTSSLTSCFLSNAPSESKISQQIKHGPMVHPKPLMEIDIANLRNKADSLNCHQLDGWHPNHHMENFRQNRFQPNLYPVGGNRFYSSWNNYQSGGYPPWHMPASCGFYSTAASPYPRPPFNVWNPSGHNGGYCGGWMAGGCNSSVNVGDMSWNTEKVTGAIGGTATSVASCSPSSLQCDVSLETMGTTNALESIPIPPETNLKELTSDQHVMITPNRFHTDGSSLSNLGAASARGFVELKSHPPLPSGSPPPLPAEPPPTPPPPPPSPPPSPPSSEPMEMDWMELDSPQYENQQDFETSSMDSNSLEAACTKIQNSPPKPHYPEDPKSPNGSDVASKDPASLNRMLTLENSSKAFENDPKCCNIPVFIEPADYPFSRLSDEQMTLIENSILDAILEIDENGVNPVFNESFRRNGRFGVICKGDISRKWLYAYLGTHKPWPNSNLRIVSKDFTEVRANAVLPICTDDDNETILRLIGRQNKGLEVSKWEVVRRWESDDFKTCMDLVIDDKSAKTLENCSNIIFKFGTGRIITVRKKIVDSEVSRELKKAREYGSLEDDIYGDFYDEETGNFALELEKNTEFDSLEHDIYADFYGEKPSCGDSEEEGTEQSQRLPTQRSRQEEIDSCNPPGSECSVKRHHHGSSPSRDVVDKIPKRQWSPKPGGGLCRSQDPYVRNENLFQLYKRSCRSRSPPLLPSEQDWYSQKYLSSSLSMSRSNSRQSVENSLSRDHLPSSSHRVESEEDRELPWTGMSCEKDLFSKSVVRFEGHLPNRYSGNKLPMHHGRRTRFTSQSPAPPVPEKPEDSTVGHQMVSMSTFPRVLSFQTQGFANDTWDHFPSSLFDKDKDRDLFGSDLQKSLKQSSELPNLPLSHLVHNEQASAPQSPVQLKQDVDDRWLLFSQFDIDDRQLSVAPVSSQPQSGQELHCDVHNFEDASQESSKVTTVQSDVGQHDTDENDSNVEDMYPSGSEPELLDQGSTDLVSFEVRPGQPLQDVATDHFRKLIAKGYSCEKALQITQAFVSKQLNAVVEVEPPKPPSPKPSPQPTLHEVAAEKFGKLVEAGFSHAKALQFTQAFVRRQMGQLPTPSDHLA